MALKMFIYTFQSHLFNSTISRFYISELKHQSFESEEDDNTNFVIRQVSKK